MRAEYNDKDRNVFYKWVPSWVLPETLSAGSLYFTAMFAQSGLFYAFIRYSTVHFMF